MRPNREQLSDSAQYIGRVPALGLELDDWQPAQQGLSQHTVSTWQTLKPSPHRLSAQASSPGPALPCPPCSPVCPACSARPPSLARPDTPSCLPCVAPGAAISMTWSLLILFTARVFSKMTAS